MVDKQKIDSGLVARLSGAWGELTGKNRGGANNAFFGAGQAPMPIVSPEMQDSVRGRQFDFPFGINQRTIPRQGEQTTFSQLRSLADSCDLLRLVIETRKDQLSKLKFSIRPSNPKQKVDKRCLEVEEMFKMPDGESTWDTWLRMLLEDMFVLDAATIYPWLNNDGTPYRFEILDGSTIKRVIDDHGRTPATPSPAYQQVFKGVIAVEYTAEELVYVPRNRRAHKVYGFSPVEQILMTVNIAIRRALYQLQFYTEGSAPDLLFQVPETWSMVQIKDFNDWWQASLAGNTANRRKAQFVPSGVSPVNTKDGVLTDKYDEWLARIICYAFSVSHQAFVAQVNRATADSAQQQALEEGLYPIMKWVKGVCDMLVWRYYGYKDLEFIWEDQDSVSPDVQSRIEDCAIKNGTMTINEVRANRGDDPVEGGDIPMVMGMGGYVPITQYFDEKKRREEQVKADATAAKQNLLNTSKESIDKVELKKGSPDQPRDDLGRFGETGFGDAEKSMFSGHGVQEDVDLISELDSNTTKKMDSAFKDSAPKLTEALSYYTFFGHQEFNAWQRSGKPYSTFNPGATDEEKEIMSMMAKETTRAFFSEASIVQKETNVYRGLSLSKKDLDKMLPSSKKDYVANNLVSASASFPVAKEFADKGYVDKVPVLMKITVEKGARMVRVGGASTMPEEREVLFRRGERFKIVARRDTSRGVELELRVGASK